MRERRGRSGSTCCFGVLYSPSTALHIGYELRPAARAMPEISRVFGDTVECGLAPVQPLNVNRGEDPYGIIYEFLRVRT